MTLQETVSKFKGKEVTLEYAKDFADTQFGLLASILRDQEREGKAVFEWNIEDVQSIDEDITDEQAVEILERFDHHHEGSMEAMWWDLEYHVGEYKEELEAK